MLNFLKTKLWLLGPFILAIYLIVSVVETYAFDAPGGAMFSDLDRKRVVLFELTKDDETRTISGKNLHPDFVNFYQYREFVKYPTESNLRGLLEIVQVLEEYDYARVEISRLDYDREKNEAFYREIKTFVVDGQEIHVE